ncbi:MAG: UPF0716 family protein affecting phage T7 exclusion [Candidatus Azotimanducaceae bacterium]|jgi:UPF0716 family protein affecting phage T7 exclusion
MVLTDRIGLPLTLLELLLSIALGTFLIGRSGRSIRDLMQRFQQPQPNTLWSILRPLQGLLGGLLLCLPGLISDTIGLYLAISASRQDGGSHGPTGPADPGADPRSSRVIEGEFIQEDVEKLN